MSALDFADAPPVNRGGISISFVACDNTALAADALRHVEVKTVLLACSERLLHNRVASVATLR
jgi:hypothetical protein